MPASNNHRTSVIRNVTLIQLKLNAIEISTKSNETMKTAMNCGIYKIVHDDGSSSLLSEKKTMIQFWNFTQILLVTLK